jgi:hypothetical protein
MSGIGLGSSQLKIKIDPQQSEIKTLYLSADDTIPVNSNVLGSKSKIKKHDFFTSSEC